MNKSDKLLIIILIPILLIVLLIFKLTSVKSNKIANVYYENEVILKINLEEEKEYVVKGYNGDVKIKAGNGKIKVVEEVSKSIGLKNVVASHIRGEEERGRYDFVVSRAVMPLPDLVRIVRKNISPRQRNAIANGIFCLKGGDIRDEIAPFRNSIEVMPISDWIEEEWFKEKHLIYLPL